MLKALVLVFSLVSTAAVAQVTWICPNNCIPGQPNCVCAQAQAPIQEAQPQQPNCPYNSYWNGYYCVQMAPPVVVNPYWQQHQDWQQHQQQQRAIEEIGKALQQQQQNKPKQ